MEGAGSGQGARAALSRFIAAYRDLPVLWNASLKDYSNKQKKNTAYDKLIDVYRDVKGDATREDVKRKINVLRTNYRKELKKVNESKWSGDKVYEPKCAKFHELSFLTASEGLSVSTIPSSLEVPHAKEPRDLLENAFPSDPPPKRIRLETESQQKDLLAIASYVIANDYLSRNETEEDTIVKSWAFKLKRMTDEQKLYAVKFISDVLLEGELGMLHRHSVKINEE